MPDPSSASSSPGVPGSRTFEWSWQGTPVPVGYDVQGSAAGAPVLLLPALSTVSTRAELQALAGELASRRCIVSDWPGFGDAVRPPLDYGRPVMRAFLEALVRHLRGELGAESLPVVACGHAAGYVLDLASRQPQAFSHLVLIAPTWRGPLPTMMGGRRPVQAWIRKLVQAPAIGEALYRLNVSRPVVRMMYRRHVFADPAFLSDDLLTRRMRLTRRPGARFGSASFVTGALDPFDDREACLDAARRARAPILMLYGRETPPRSRAEMEALAGVPGIEARVIARATLGMAEERAADLAPLIQAFLQPSGVREAQVGMS